jgi:hypothetical protein
VAHTAGYLELVATSRTYRVNYVNPIAVASSGVYTFMFSGPIDMTAGDTAKVQVTVINGTPVVDVYGAGTLSGTLFSGHLVP